MNNMVPYIWAAGGVQLAIAVANFWVPGILRYRENLARPSPMMRQVFIVHATYIVLVLLGFSALSFFFAVELARGTPLGRLLTTTGK